MPARTDHDARRRDVSEAVWRVLAEHGFGGLTLRAVAAEMGASTGLLTHYFPSKHALVRYALEIAAERTDARPRLDAEPGIAALRAAILHVLPVSAAAVAMNKVWVGSWDGALVDPDRKSGERARYRRWRSHLRPLVVAAQERGELGPGDPDDLVAIVAAFTHGLVVQALFDPRAFPHARQEALTDTFLEGLTPARR
jgi:AcrR family transcriptional regulator